ncbi:MAG: AbrB/MazE/SpoVT family DNA-binding domain-containing protein [Oscillospiraceae bacterium]|jgi:AbrB family transcriptional regulator (stage V sporulation protein T)|nr:AbrB/MazE/SpoVT family DNA-binding domain-containing protein [Oscillospiraceae bacterium]
MKATGIVRRIDDLGRIVIPKEIRRTMRIREGDPLEIYTDNDGEVVFKKYSPIGELSPHSSQYADVLCKNSGFPALICDRDHIVAAAGVSRKEYQGRRISPELEELMEERKNFSSKPGESKNFVPVEGLERKASVVFPVIASGDISGAVILLENDSGSQPKDSDIKMAQVAAGFLSRQIEE